MRNICKVDGCERVCANSGFCGMHYLRFKRHGDPLKVVMLRYTADSICNVEKCGDRPMAKGLCQRHWQAVQRQQASQCTVQACMKKVKAKGLCGTHYNKQRSEAKENCKIEGCEKKIHVKEMCNQHYTMWLKHGDPMAGSYRMPFKKAIDHGDGTRTCSKCMERMSLNSFHKDKSATGGIRSTCKKCRISHVQVWYQENILDRRQHANKRRKDNQELERQKDNERYERDREKRIALATEHSHRRKARKLNTVVEKGISVLSLKKRHGTKCHYCEKEMDFSKGVGRKFNHDMATIEHLIPLARGGEHTFVNTVLACRFCNISRGAKSQEDFENYRNKD